MKSYLLILVALLFCTQAVMAGGNLSGEYESRTSTDKTNLFYRTDHLEVYVLKTNNLEIEAGPCYKIGLVSVTTKFGGVWKVADSSVYTKLTQNFFIKFGRVTCLSVNVFSLEGSSFKNPKFDWAYNEGFIMVGLDGLLLKSEVGVFYEHYRKAGDEVWVVGPRYNLLVNKGYLRSISLWAGVTDNPTAAVNFTFCLDL